MTVLRFEGEGLTAKHIEGTIVRFSGPGLCKDCGLHTELELYYSIPRDEEITSFDIDVEFYQYISLDCEGSFDFRGIDCWLYLNLHGESRVKIEADKLMSIVCLDDSRVTAHVSEEVERCEAMNNSRCFIRAHRVTRNIESADHAQLKVIFKHGDLTTASASSHSELSVDGPASQFNAWDHSVIKANARGSCQVCVGDNAEIDLFAGRADGDDVHVSVESGKVNMASEPFEIQ